MSKWVVNKRHDGRTDIFEDGGSAEQIYCVALDMRPEVAEQIVREHNAHEALVRIVRSLRCFNDGKHWDLPCLDTVLARAEGTA